MYGYVNIRNDQGIVIQLHRVQPKPQTQINKHASKECF
jgi:hypothetical protein